MGEHSEKNVGSQNGDITKGIVKSEKFARQIKKVTDPLTQQLADFCELK